MENRAIKTEYDNIIILIILSINISEFLKRFIYIGGPISALFYYLMIFFPYTMLLYIFIKKIKYRKSGLLLYLSIIFFFLVVAAFKSDGLGGSIVFIGSTIIYTLPFFCVPQVIIESNNRIVKTAFIIILISVIYGCFQFGFGYFIWDRNWAKYAPTQMNLFNLSNFGRFNRAFSIYSGLQDFSYTIVFLSGIVFLRTNKNNSIRGLNILLSAIGLYISAAKTIILALMLTAFLFSIRKRLNPTIMVVMIVFVPLLLFIFASVILSQYIEYLSILGPTFNPGTMLPRISIVASFFKDLSVSESLIGTGLGTAEMSDNMYIHLIQSYGFLGLALFTSLIIIVYTQIHEMSLLTDRSYRKYADFLFIQLTVLLVSMHAAEILVSRLMISYFTYVIMQVVVLSRKRKEGLIID